MHEHRRQLPAFTCCDPIREWCVGRDFATMFDHAKARAEVTGYRQWVIWKPQHGGWLVFTRSKQIKRRIRTFDNDVRKINVDRE